jgi:integrase
MKNQNKIQDETFHQYHRKYAVVLHKLFPTQFPLTDTHRIGNLYKINEKNRALLYKFYQHVEIEDVLSMARRVRLFMLLGVMGEMLEEKVFDQLTREDVQTFVTNIRQHPGWSRTTQNYHLKAFKKYLKHLNGGEHYPPCVSWLRLKEPRHSPIQKEDLITEEEMIQILEKNTNTMHRCIFALLWEGLRVGELGTLRCKNVTFEEKEVFISVNGKTGERTVLSISGAPYIRQWLDQHPTQDPNDWLFVISSNYNKGSRMGYHSIRKIVFNGCKKAGIKNKRIHPHLFRHSSITDRRRKGMRQREATAFFGVSGEVMSHVYDHLADSDVYDEV